MRDQIRDIFAADPDAAYTTEELCERVYAVGRAEKKHRVPVTEGVVAAGDEAAERQDGAMGRHVRFRAARQPARRLQPIQRPIASDGSGQGGLSHEQPPEPLLDAFAVERDERCRKQFERDDYRKRREPGGDIWWEVAEAVAERDGDAETLAKAKAFREARERQYQAMMSDLASR